MKLYRKEYYGCYCSGGSMLISAHTVKEAEVIAKKYYDKSTNLSCDCSYADIEKARAIRLVEYKGQTAKVLSCDIFQE